MIVAYIDGGSRGNPGPAGYGVRVESPEGEALAEFHAAIGIATNNVAEYNGLIAALRFLSEQGYRRALVRSDSELLVKQMRGEYRVKNPGLFPLYQEAKRIAAGFESLRFEHVRRERNAHADRLANTAMDEAR
jgi:ribonuclease HI